MENDIDDEIELFNKHFGKFDKNEEYLFAKKRIVVSTQPTSGSGYGMTKHRKDPSINVIQRLKL